MKTVLIAKSSSSSWVSCQSITANLIKLYQSRSNLLGCELLSFDEADSFYELYQKVQKLQAQGVQRLVFLDHHPHPQSFLEVLADLYRDHSKADRPEIIFHLFGDFTLFAARWQASEKWLKSFSVKWVCASVNQAKLVSGLIQEGESSVEVLPFPVDDSFYTYSPVEREKFRQRYELTPQSKAILYTGRLSLQKNVIELVKIFDSLKDIFAGEDVRLYLAGGFDDLNLPFVGKSGLKGSYYHLWQNECAAILDRGSIVLLGQLSRDQLKEAYCGADLFVSLSTHNDEDYGMSPAEGLLCGLPMLLSQWGGYPSFKTDHEVNLVGVDFQNEARVTPMMKEGQKVLTKLILQESLESDYRMNLSKQRALEFGISHMERALDEILSKPTLVFSGFNSKFSRLSSHFMANPQAPFANAASGHNDFYRELYQVYTQEERSWKK